MTTVDILEGTMLIFFSISWYWSIAKMLVAKVASGKSLIFVLMICFGYMFGISSKLLAWQAGEGLSPLVWIYAWNFVITVFDAALVIYYSSQRTAPEEVLPVAEAPAARQSSRDSSFAFLPSIVRAPMSPIKRKTARPASPALRSRYNSLTMT